MDETPPPEKDVPASSPADTSSIEPPPVLAVEVREKSPLRWRELLVVLVLVVLCDLTIYRGQGFAGYALLFAVAPVLLIVGAYRPRFGPFVWLVGLMMLVGAAKLLWCGSALMVGSGFVLLVAFAMSLTGLTPYVVEVVMFASYSIVGGYEGLGQYGRCLAGASPDARRVSWLNYLLPVVTLIAFGSLFILANPDLLALFNEHLQKIVEELRLWIIEYARLTEILFWLAVVWISVGLLRPMLARSKSDDTSEDTSTAPGETEEPEKASLYLAFRNTLLAVIVLFAIYLFFEFQTMWFRVFEEGFYYSGYAHNGAAWLTVALALATLLLSVVFRGRVLLDPRVRNLRRLSWLWSLENFVLAVVVYRRMWIYVEFNGMSRMRTVGIFGMTAVVIGFILVLYKITRGRSFLWLLRANLWTLALTLFLYGLTPVDTIVVKYNVHRILLGDLAPSVQISEHPISSEGILLLIPLLECDDVIIREGIRAMLADRHADAADLVLHQHMPESWTAYQFSDKVVLDRLHAAREQWSEYKDLEKRDAALYEFQKYAYQWY